jgi:two-component system chemotaxis response regulator CheY
MMNAATPVISAPQALKGLPAGSNNPTILVIDDSAICRELVSDALRGNGFLTIAANNGKAGLDQMESQHVDAIVLDYEMPTMDGPTFLMNLRAKPQWHRIPVLMLTTNISKDIVAETMRYHLFGYMLKVKFSMPEMLVRIQSALRSNNEQTKESHVSQNFDRR